MQDSNELYHYGRLGMKWGQHRYRDKYGGITNAGHVKLRKLESEHDRLSSITALTKKGEKRKSDVSKQYEHLTGKPIESHPTSTSALSKPKPKSVSEMTNEELTTYNTRKQLETTYQNFQPKPKESRGKKFIATVSKQALAPLAKEINKQVVVPRVMEMIKKLDAERLATKALK